jgi:hypothetical protein
MSTQLTITTATQQLMAKTFERQKLDLPLGRDIFLLETHVAGLPYHQAHVAVPSLVTVARIGADSRYATDEMPDVRLNISLRD